MGTNVKSKKVIFTVILVFASALRIFDLSIVPPHPSLDEVSIGYNAYSILKTGADEFGSKFPVLLRAYDDYRPAHYTYLVVPFVYLLDLNTVSVRLPSVILSIATVASIYFLVYNLVRSHEKKSFIALTTMSFIAISPWHIYISRLGHEVNLFFSTFIFGVTLIFFYFHSKKSFFLLTSAFFFAISFSSYQSGKIFIPLILLCLLFVYRKVFLKDKIKALIAVCIFLAVSFPILITSTSSEALVRYQATNIFSLAGPLVQESAEKVLRAKEEGDFLGQIVNNRRFVYIFLPINAYMSHFNPFWLVGNGGEEPFKVPHSGLLHTFDLPLILIGAYYFAISRKIERKVKIFLVAWLFISILPGAITTGFPHAMRTFQVLPVPQIIAGLGLVALINRKKSRSIALTTIFMLYIVSLSIFMAGYFYSFTKDISWQFQYGVKDALLYASSVEHEYDHVFVEKKEYLFQSYMFYLFFNKYEPSKYQEQGGTLSGGYDENHRIGKYYFMEMPEKLPEKSLVIANSRPNNKNIVYTIFSPQGVPVIDLMEY